MATFDALKAKMDEMLARMEKSGAPAEAPGLRDAMVDTAAALRELREALASTERELASERAHLETAARRGRLAGEVEDGETAAVAERFAGKHRERVLVLERKLAVQREELALAERELQEMKAQHRQRGGQRAASSLDAAWRELEAAGGVRPETEFDGALGRLEEERALRERAVEEQLAYLKKKLGKD